MLPPVSGSSPAMQLSAVVLPQPDGPRRAMNSPAWIVRLSSRRAACSPKLRLTASRRSSEKRCSCTARFPFLLLADRAVPDVERGHLLVGGTRRLLWVLRDPLLVFRTLSLIHISEPTRLGMISYAVFCLKKKKKKTE